MIDAHLARIEEVNPAVNAITVVVADRARAAADAADHSPPTGPLHGVPITVKENIDLLGTPTTSGLTVFAEALPTANAPIVDRMLAAVRSRSAAPICPNSGSASTPAIDSAAAPAMRGTRR